MTTNNNNTNNNNNNNNQSVNNFISPTKTSLRTSQTNFTKKYNIQKQQMSSQLNLNSTETLATFQELDQLYKTQNSSKSNLKMASKAQILNSKIFSPRQDDLIKQKNKDLYSTQKTFVYNPNETIEEIQKKFIKLPFNKESETPKNQNNYQKQIFDKIQNKQNSLSNKKKSETQNNFFIMSKVGQRNLDLTIAQKQISVKNLASPKNFVQNQQQQQKDLYKKRQNIMRNKSMNQLPTNKSINQKQNQSYQEDDDLLNTSDIHNKKKPSTLKKKQKLEAKKWQFSEDILDISEQESKKIMDNKYQLVNLSLQEGQQNLYSQLLSNVKDIIESMIPMSSNLKSLLYDKENLDLKFRQLIAEASRSRNPVLSIMVTYSFAKTCLRQKDFLQAIELFKLCKNQCQTFDSLQKYKQRCYKNLGFCYQQIKKYRVSLVYYTKYLKFSYYLEDREQELKAYDYIGLTYFYLGDLEKAAYYHERMFRGDHENLSSDIIKIIKSKIKLALTKEGLQEKDAIKNNKFQMNDNVQPDVSSSEDEGIPINENIRTYLRVNPDQSIPLEVNNHIIVVDEETQKPIFIPKKRFSSRDIYQMKVLFKKSDPNNQQNSIKQANSNIRIVQKELEKLDTKNLLKGFYKSNTAQNRHKNPVLRVNHLSVIRDLSNYSNFDPRLNQKQGFPKSFYDQNDVAIQRKILKIINKLNDNIFCVVSLIDRIISNYDKLQQQKQFEDQIVQSNIPQKRKGVMLALKGSNHINISSNIKNQNQSQRNKFLKQKTGDQIIFKNQKKSIKFD